MKKTNKENPLVTFRKMNEARNKTVGKSLRKAQDGLESNGDAMDMINKPGSTGGYKSTPTWSDPAKEAARKALIKGAFSSPENDPLNEMYKNVSMDNERRRNIIPNDTVAKPAVLGNFGDKPMNTISSVQSKHKTGGTHKKKFDDGGLTGKQNRLARQEKRVYNKYTDAKNSGNTEKSSRLYDKLLNKQTKSIKAGVNVKYKKGGTTKATKFAALAPPYNKATFADRIVGAKKNAKKK
jgi:hypothetical protein